MTTPATPDRPGPLSAAESRLRDAVASARKRKTFASVAMVILCLVLAGYLGFAYYQIAQVDADTVIALAETQADPLLNQPASQWASELESRAPAVIDEAGEAALGAPEAFADRVLTYVEGRAEAELPELEKEFNQMLETLLARADEAIRAEYPDGKIPLDQAEPVLTQVAQQFGDSLQTELDRVYDRYADVSAQLIDQLDALSQTDGLTETQRLHKQLLESFLTLLQRVQARA
jgi:hypothetical protein